MQRHKLAHPFEHGSTRVEELTLRRPTFADLRAVDATKGQFAQLSALLTRIAGVVGDESLTVTERMIDRLDVEDVAALGEKVATFFPRGLPTGESD